MMRHDGEVCCKGKRLKRVCYQRVSYSFNELLQKKGQVGLSVREENPRTHFLLKSLVRGIFKFSVSMMYYRYIVVYLSEKKGHHSY